MSFEYRRPRAPKRRERGRRPGLARPEEVQALVDRVLDRQIPRTRRRLLRIQAAWDSIAPRRVARHTWPVWISERNRLLVVVQNSQWLHELHYLRQPLLEKLLAELPNVGVTGIDVRQADPRRRHHDEEPVDALGRPLEPILPSAEPPGPAPEAPLPESPSPEVLEALNSVQDRALRDQLAATRLVLGRPPARKGQ